MNAARGEPRGPFVVDVTHARIHRSAQLRPECRAEIDWPRAQYPEDMLKATMVMKTRHYLPCPRCWG